MPGRTPITVVAPRTITWIVLWTVLLTANAAAQDYTLEAPERAHIRQTIEVGWSAPQASGGRIEIRPSAGGRAAS